MKEKYELDTKENKEFVKDLAEGLLAFGRRFPSPEGGAWYLGDDGAPWKDRSRETWITCRMAHCYSLGVFLGFDGSKELVEKAVQGLLGELSDQENGGFYAGVRADGSILPDKQCYAHAFVILAATSALLVKAEGAKELLHKALEVYDERFWEEENGLAADTWDTAFTKKDPYRGINANMHSVEALLAAADVLKEEKYRVRAGRIIDHVIAWAKEEAWRIPEHFTERWEPDLLCNQDKPDDPFKPFGATPGHGIEWARLITQWAFSSKSDEERRPYLDAAVNLYQRAVEDGWNADGAPGLVYTTDWEGQPVVHDRMHWTLAEAINTSAVLFRATGEDRFRKDYAMFMEYLDETVLDHEKGSWFHQLDRENKVIGTIWPGKADLYHALQAMLIPYNEELGLSIAPALAAGESGHN